MDNPYQGQTREPAAVQPRVNEPRDLPQPRQGSYTPAYNHADPPGGTGPQQHAAQHHQPQQGAAPYPPVLQGHPPVLQGHAARSQDVRVQCEAADCQALLQVRQNLQAWSQ